MQYTCIFWANLTPLSLKAPGGGRLWLHLRGISYSATVYVNGEARARSHCHAAPPFTHFIPDRFTNIFGASFLRRQCGPTLGKAVAPANGRAGAGSKLTGMYRRWSFDLGAAAGVPLTIAVRVEPPPHYGGARFPWAVEPLRAHLHRQSGTRSIAAVVVYDHVYDHIFERVPMEEGA